MLESFWSGFVVSEELNVRYSADLHSCDVYGFPEAGSLSDSLDEFLVSARGTLGLFEEEGSFVMVRLVDRGGVVIILDSLDVGVDAIVVEIPGISGLDSLFPLEISVGVIVSLTFFASCVSCFVDEAEAFNLSHGAEKGI